MSDWASRPKPPTNSSKLFIQPRPMEWESGCMSASPLSRGITGVCGRQPMMGPAPHFRLLFLADPSLWTTLEAIPTGQIQRDLCPAFLVGREQYQRRIDAPSRVVHCVVMKFDQGNAAAEPPLLSVVDDDEMLRESLFDLLGEFGFTARAFSSGQEFLSSDYVDETRCLILDVTMPGMSGLDLQKELKRRGQAIPIIFITGQKDEDARKRAFRQGAINFLYKPFSDNALLDAVNAAFNGHLCKLWDSTMSFANTIGNEVGSSPVATAKPIVFVVDD